jgi:hypothetical protein
MAREKLYANQAEKQAAYRARHDLVQLTVELPRDLVDEFAEFLKFKNVTKAACVEKLLRTQLLRKR